MKHAESEAECRNSNDETRTKKRREGLATSSRIASSLFRHSVIRHSSLIGHSNFDIRVYELASSNFDHSSSTCPVPPQVAIFRDAPRLCRASQRAVRCIASQNFVDLPDGKIHSSRRLMAATSAGWSTAWGDRRLARRYA